MAVTAIAVWESINLAAEVGYPVTGFVLSALGADIELYLFADTIKLRWEATAQPLDRQTLERIVFTELPRLIFASSVLPVEQLLANTSFHYQFSRDDQFTRLHLRSAHDQERYRALTADRLHDLECLMYNVHYTSAQRWRYCFALEAGDYPELSIMLPLHAGYTAAPRLADWLLRRHAEHRFVSADDYAGPLAQAIREQVAQRGLHRPVMLA